MFQSSSYDRKPLLRSNSDRPSMRNWPLFAFLFGLVFFFYIFYIYQSQSTEMAILREQLDNQLRSNKELKSQFIAAKADNELLKSSESSLKTTNQECATKYDECSKSLQSSKIKAEFVQSEKTKVDDSVKTKDEELQKLKDDLVVYERNNTALKSLLGTQEGLSYQLNETITVLKDEIATLKSNQQAKERSATDTKDAAVQTQPEAPKVEEKKTDVVGAPVIPVAESQKEAPLSGGVEAASTSTQAAANTDAATTTTVKNVEELEQAKHDAPQVEAPKLNENGEKGDAKEEVAQQEKPVVQGGDYVVDDKDDKTNQLVDNKNSEAEEGGL